MSAPTSPRLLASQRGVTLVELMIALIVLSLGVLAVGQLFPAGSRGQLQDRMMTTASNHARDKLEELSTKSWTDPDLTVGRHPAGIATEALGGGKWQRFYDVAALASPLDNLRRVSVTVSWTYLGARSVRDTIYLRR